RRTGNQPENPTNQSPRSDASLGGLGICLLQQVVLRGALVVMPTWAQRRPEPPFAGKILTLTSSGIMVMLQLQTVWQNRGIDSPGSMKAVSFRHHRRAAALLDD